MVRWQPEWPIIAAKGWEIRLGYRQSRAEIEGGGEIATEILKLIQNLEKLNCNCLL